MARNVQLGINNFPNAIIYLNHHKNPPAHMQQQSYLDAPFALLHARYLRWR
jgi:hypothetical protein